MKREFCNPVSYTDSKTYTNPDPYILRWCGLYYCYSTGEDGVNVSSSEDLVNWTYQGFALSIPGKKSFWAPAVIYRNGVFYMYFSCLEKDAEDVHSEFMFVATAENPLGPFEVKKQLFNKFSIDAHPVEINGDVFLFYSVNDVTGLNKHNAGTCILVDKLEDMYTLSGNPKPVVLPSLASEIYAKDRFCSGQHWHTIEGACYYEYRNKAYLIFSANAYVNTDYYLSYAVAEKNGDFLSWEWKKYPDNYTSHSLVKKSDLVEGTGHNTVTKAPNLVDDWLVYHGRNALDELRPDVEQRVMRIDQLFVDGGQLVTSAPTASSMPGPELPAIHAKNLQCRTENILYNDDRGFYTAELWVCPSYNKEEHRGVHYSVLIDNKGNSKIEIELVSGLNSITVNLFEKNIQTVLSSIKLPAGFNFFVPHLYTVTKMFELVSVAVDNRFECSFYSPLPFGSLVFLPRMLPVVVNSFTLTAHVSLWKNHLSKLNRFYDFEYPVLADDSGLAGSDAFDTELSFRRKNLHYGDFKECIEFQPLCSRAFLKVFVNAGGENWRETCSYKAEDGICNTSCTFRWNYGENFQVKICGQYVKLTGYSLTVLN